MKLKVGREKARAELLELTAKGHSLLTYMREDYFANMNQASFDAQSLITSHRHLAETWAQEVGAWLVSVFPTQVEKAQFINAPRTILTMFNGCNIEWCSMYNRVDELLAVFTAMESRLLIYEDVADSNASQPTALLITAVSSERKALREVLRAEGTEPSLDEIGGRYFDHLVWPGRLKSWNLYVGQPTEKGPHATQALLQDFIRFRRPDVVLMVGMCGGLPEHGAKEASVIVARHVFNYEPGRLRDGGLASSPTVFRSSARIIDLANYLVSHGAWGDMNVFTTKDFGSGEKLVDDLNSDTRQKLLQYSGDIIGFEMEAPGLLQAVWEIQRTTHFDVGIVKGVADFGDGNQRENKEHRQTVATSNAVRVALKLLSEY